jgi:hypothetical protein
MNLKMEREKRLKEEYKKMRIDQVLHEILQLEKEDREKREVEERVQEVQETTLQPSQMVEVIWTDGHGEIFQTTSYDVEFGKTILYLTDGSRIIIPQERIQMLRFPSGYRHE